MSDNDSNTEEIELQATGPTLEELMAAAAEQVFGVAYDLETIKERSEPEFSLPWEGTSEDMLYSFLDATMDILNQEAFIVKSCEVDVDSDEINVTMRGIPFDPEKHTMIMEVKGITKDSIIMNEDMHGTFNLEFSLDA